MRVEGLGFCMLLLQCCLLSIIILFIYWCVQSAYLNECCAWLQLQLIPTTQFWGQNNSVRKNGAVARGPLSVRAARRPALVLDGCI